MELKFGNPVFKEGLNLTVRRGTFWDTQREAEIYLNHHIYKVDIFTRVMRFRDLTDRILEDEHDPECRTVVGLREVMEKTYSQFWIDEIVTLVFFIKPPGL